MPTLGAWVSDEISERADRIAAEQHISRSELVKQAFENATIEDKTPLLELINEVKAIGINVNQIAKRCNTKKVVDRLTYDSLIEIENKLEKLL